MFQRERVWGRTVAAESEREERDRANGLLLK